MLYSNILAYLYLDLEESPRTVNQFSNAQGKKDKSCYEKKDKEKEQRQRKKEKESREEQSMFAQHDRTMNNVFFY
jgi:hypothetical protein